MNTKHYKNCQNNYKYLKKYEDDEFIIDRKIKRNYRKYRHKIDTTTIDTESFEEDTEKQKTSIKNKSVKKVIEKFNRLSCNNNFNDSTTKPPEQIQFSSNEIIPEKPENKPVHKDEKKCDRTNKKKKVKNYEKSLIKYSSPRLLQCSEKINSNSKNNNDDFFNIFKVPDEYISFINDVRRRNIIKYTPKNTLDNLQLSKNELKHFKSRETQTTPFSSNTNILINVYNAPSPRIYNNLEPCSKLLQLKVSQDDQSKLLITDFPNNTTKMVERKKSVKNCVREFEEFMKKKDPSKNKSTDATKTKYKRNASDTLLSPRAKSVPF